jgi:hypothetical protein
MTFKGRISAGSIILDEPINFPEGTHVIIEIEKTKSIDSTGIAGSWIDDRSAQEIIQDIHSSRQSRTQGGK